MARPLAKGLKRSKRRLREKLLLSSTKELGKAMNSSKGSVHILPVTPMRVNGMKVSQKARESKSGKTEGSMKGSSSWVSLVVRAQKSLLKAFLSKDIGLEVNSSRVNLMKVSLNNKWKSWSTLKSSTFQQIKNSEWPMSQFSLQSQ